MMAEVVAGVATDAGGFREQNEDAVAVWSETQAHLESNGRLFALADGMGGHNNGEVASADALRILFDRFYSDSVDDVATALKTAFRTANQHLYSEGAAQGPEKMMGTTLVAGVVRRNLLVVANVGDSRAYILRGGRAQQVTRDHSLVAEQVKEGVITAEEARSSRHRHVITRAIGHADRIDVDIFEVPLLPRDAILLASDGLYGTIADDELASLALGDEPAAAALRLVDSARERHSTDNASAVIIHYQRAADERRLGDDLFDTAELPGTRVPSGTDTGRPRSPLPLIAAAIVALLVLAIIAFFFISGGLPGPIG